MIDPNVTDNRLYKRLLRSTKARIYFTGYNVQTLHDVFKMQDGVMYKRLPNGSIVKVKEVI